MGTRTFTKTVFEAAVEEAVFAEEGLTRAREYRLKRKAEEIALDMLAAGAIRVEEMPRTSDARAWRLSVTVQDKG